MKTEFEIYQANCLVNSCIVDFHANGGDSKHTVLHQINFGPAKCLLKVIPQDDRMNIIFWALTDGFFDFAPMSWRIMTDPESLPFDASLLTYSGAADYLLARFKEVGFSLNSGFQPELF